MHPIRANLKVVFNTILLPREPPVWCNTPNVEWEFLAGRRLWRPDVTRTVDTAGKIQMLVSHCVDSQSCHILPQTTLDNGGSSRGWCYVASHERKAPSRCTVP